MLLFVSLAFPCPTIATGTPSSLSFDTAQVAIVRQDQRTTFSVSINPVGDPQSFALVLPVPKVLAEDEITTLDPAIFARLDGYTAPRHVDDAGCPSSSGGLQLDSSDTGSDDGGGVDVEAEYLVGEYQVVILSAEESGSLATWLDSNGYYLPAGADERLAEYIDAGSYFLAAKVAEEAAVATGVPLSPLQVSYDSEIFAIPIRLATLNSPGEQDMVIYALTEIEGGSDAGQVAIANYPQFTVPDRCIWGNASTDDFTAFYEDTFTAAWTAAGGGAWTMEFAGGFYDCNPCTSTTITEDDVAALGFQGDPYAHHLTRVHMRYTPEQATSDLVLYGSGLYEPMVVAYADDWEANYECVDSFCTGEDTPWEGDSGSDDGDPPGTSGGDDDEADGANLSDAGTGCGCGTRGLPGWALALAGTGLAARRRR
ncbi:MAG: DUF2330 domain-containing protein [Deltaproteobacteria bacterium]|nr:DUF2330 domain-containing protein [Deltaproteobacteria bacterium]